MISWSVVCEGDKYIVTPSHYYLIYCGEEERDRKIVAVVVVVAVLLNDIQK